MENETTAAIDRPAVTYDKIPRGSGKPDRLLLIQDAKLHQQVRKAQRLGLVDDQTHGALVAMRADIYHRAREAVILHARHGNQELVVEKTARCGSFLPQKVH